MSILVLIDVSAPPRSIVDLAVSLAEIRDEDLVLVHANRESERTPLEPLAVLHKLAEPVRLRGVAVRIRVISGDLVGSICGWIHRHAVSMIVTGIPEETDPQERESRMVRELAGCATVPTLMVRPGTGGLGPSSAPIVVWDAPQPEAWRLGQELCRYWGRTLDTVVLGDAEPFSRLKATGPHLWICPVDRQGRWPEGCASFLRSVREMVIFVASGAADSGAGVDAPAPIRRRAR